MLLNGKQKSVGIKKEKKNILQRLRKKKIPDICSNAYTCFHKTERCLNYFLRKIVRRNSGALSKDICCTTVRFQAQLPRSKTYYFDLNALVNAITPIIPPFSFRLALNSFNLSKNVWSILSRLAPLP